MNTIFIMVSGFDYLLHLQNITYIKLANSVLFTLNGLTITYVNKVQTYYVALFYTNKIKISLFMQLYMVVIYLNDD